jgi:histidinol-phosphate aminotransferase
MPRFRSDIDHIVPYSPGRSIEEVAAELGISDVAKLASNECPFPPWPEVLEAMRRAAQGVNRYPDYGVERLSRATAHHLGVPSSNLWFGAGSSDLLRCMGLAMGGPGTSAVYASPSFVLYRVISHIAGSEPIEVPLGEGWVHDPEKLVGAVRDDTTLLYLCNPNNPTSTHLSEDAIKWIVEQVSDRVLIVVDEAYLHYVEAPDYATATPLALERANVVVTHTFSKIFALAGVRVGYAIAQPDTITQLSKAQGPFVVTSVGQAAATEALLHTDRLGERITHNARERSRLLEALARLGVEHADSQTNFVFHRSAADATGYLPHGVIVRPAGEGWVRTTVGLEEENDRFLEAVEMLGLPS